MVKINSYSFGFMDVDGTAHTTDLMILPSGVVPNWWRKKGHLLCVEDIAPLLEEPPRVLIIGTGYNGRMKIDPSAKKALEDAGIRLIIEKTGSAWKSFNATKEEPKAALFHLTC